MAKYPKNLVGIRYGKLYVESKIDSTYYLCRCDCGNTKKIRKDHIASNSTKSCGCLWAATIKEKNTKHGFSRRKKVRTEYSIWMGMIKRCYNVNCKNYESYGGRGIKVCDRWRNSFEDFYADMGDRPSLKHSLDRFPNNDGNYEPGNVRWGTYEKQSRNRRSNVWLEHDGIKMVKIDWAKKLGIDRKSIDQHFGKGRTFEQIVNIYS